MGVQIYVWTVNPTNAALSSWVFKAPHAVLFGTEKDEKGDVVGIHFGGPTWESNSGSKVVGTRVASSTVDSHAIPWLLLSAASTAGDGIFANTTYIQRVHTVGGLAPTTPGTTRGEEVLVQVFTNSNIARSSSTASTLGPKLMQNHPSISGLQ